MRRVGTAHEFAYSITCTWASPIWPFGLHLCTYVSLPEPHDMCGWFLAKFAPRHATRTAEKLVVRPGFTSLLFAR
jgi:hypothetical protein